MFHCIYDFSILYLQQLEGRREPVTLPPLTPTILQSLLNKHDFGKLILKTAKTHKLSHNGCKLVVETVAQYHLDRGNRCTSETLNDLSEVIISLFVKESKVGLEST